MRPVRALTCIVLACVIGQMRAQRSPLQSESTAPLKNYVDWNDPAWWEYVAKSKQPGVRLGHSDFVASGPLVGSLTRRREEWRDLSPLDKALNFPIVGWIVPQPMPRPPGHGKYFYWGDRDVAWSTFATGVNPARHSMFDFLNRSLNSYMPELSSSRVSNPDRILKLGKYRIPLSRPIVEMRRKSKTFWQILGERQISSWRRVSWPWTRPLRIP